MRDESDSATAGTGAGVFPRTRWTLVEQIRGGGASGERALGELCGLYWYPVYAYLRRTGASPPDAEDLTQGFFERLLEKDMIAAADAEKGKLRTYLLTALKRFSISQYRKQNRLKRGRGIVVVPLDADDAEERFRDEPAELDDPEKLFERRWALSLLEEAMVRLREEYQGSGKEQLFEALSPFLAGREEGDDRYTTLGGHLGMTTGAVQVAVHRLRKRFRRQLEEAVAETVGEDAAGELRHLLSVIFSR